MNNANHPWQTSPQLWAKLKPFAQQMRRQPTAAEHMLWQALRRRQVDGFKFRRQHTIERFIVDFYCPEASLIIEVDGPIHEYTAEKDAIRQAFLEAQGHRVVRITNEAVFQALPEVIEYIRAALHTAESDLTP
jgi:very-short-patch-repair endonuclease